jgi:hypothetical protein
MPCYEYEIIHRTETPTLNVDLAIILAMKGTNRFIRDPFVLNLSKITIIQWNHGFKKCKKPDAVNKASKDILHAYMTAWNYSKKYNNVIIFEDDAQIINKDITVYNKINKFISCEKFIKNKSIFTFGSITSWITCNNDFLKKKFDSGFSMIQAVVYSKKSREFLLLEAINKGYNLGQVDAQLLGLLDNTFSYKYPLIVQIWPDSDNMADWFNSYNPVIRPVMEFCVRNSIKTLHLDTKPDNWSFIYFIYSEFGLIFIGIIILLLLLLFYKN